MYGHLPYTNRTFDRLTASLCYPYRDGADTGCAPLELAAAGAAAEPLSGGSFIPS